MIRSSYFLSVAFPPFGNFDYVIGTVAISFFGHLDLDFTGAL